MKAIACGLPKDHGRIVDNGSAHRGQKSIERLEGRWPNLWSSPVFVDT